jgi:hypothetical protein
VERVLVRRAFLLLVMPKPQYPRYTAEERKLTDIRYLVNHMVAHTHEAKMILNELPALMGDRQWQRMYYFIHKVAPGNAEAERIYRLVNESEPYTQQVRVNGIYVTQRTPDMAGMEAARKQIEDLFI